ncbi:MAG: YecA family protein [Archaeoglobaceae archaeon]
MTEQVGRNDPCPCGSGLKYKKCCLKDRQKKETEITEKLNTAELSVDTQEENEQEDYEVEPKMEYEDVSDGDAVQLYTKEFALRGYNIRLDVLKTFFNRCLQKDGVVDSQRVEELCNQQRKHEKIVITSEDVDQFFDEL